MVYCTFFPSHRQLHSTRANPLTLGHHIELDPQRQTFVLHIPACWYPKTLADTTQGPMQVVKYSKGLIALCIVSLTFFLFFLRFSVFLNTFIAFFSRFYSRFRYQHVGIQTASENARKTREKFKKREENARKGLPT